MTTDTFFAAASDDTIASGGLVTYAAAAAGSGLTVATDPWLTIGQIFVVGNYGIFQTFLAFDTSAIPDANSVSAVTLSIWGDTNATVTDFTIEAYAFDFGVSVTTADWLTPAAIGGLTRVGTFATTGFTVGAYNDFTADAAMLAAINKTGETRFVLVSSRNRTATAPTGDEYVRIKRSEEAGTTNDPKLVVVHDPVNVTPSPVTLTLSPLTPVPEVGQDVATTPVAMVLAPQAPAVVVGTFVSVPAPAALVLTQSAPTVVSDTAVAVPAPVALVLSPQAPAPAGATNVSAPVMNLVMAQLAPTVTATGSVTPAVLAMILSPQVPSPSGQANVSAPVHAMVLAMHTPTLLVIVTKDLVLRWRVVPIPPDGDFVPPLPDASGPPDRVGQIVGHGG